MHADGKGSEGGQIPRREVGEAMVPPEGQVAADSRADEPDYPVISHPYGEKYGSALYRMHAYRGRKPPNVVAHYIKRHTEEGQVVLDPFLGSGTTAIEAIRLGRRVVGFDLNPHAIFIAKATLEPVRLMALESAYELVLSQASEECRDLWVTKCPKCRQPAEVSCAVWTGDGSGWPMRSPSTGRPLQVVFRCECSGGQLQAKEPDARDRSLISESDRADIPHWWPGECQLPAIRKEKGEAQGFADLYTRRNLFCLASLLNAIDTRVSDQPVRDTLRLAFSSAALAASRLAGIDNRHGSPIRAMGWILPSFRIMREHAERNPIEAFANAFQRVIRGKQEANRVLQYFREGSIDEVLSGSATAALVCMSSTRMDEVLPRKSVDYVFTDPPHGASIQSIALSAPSMAWLGMNADGTEEIVEDPLRETKSSLFYYNQLRQVFDAVERAVEGTKPIHVYFRGADASAWQSMAVALVGDNRHLQQIIFQPQRLSFRKTFRGRRGVAGAASDEGGKDRATSSSHAVREVPGDPIIRLTVGPHAPGARLDTVDVERRVVERAREAIIARAQPAPFGQLLMSAFQCLPSRDLKEYGSQVERLLKAHANYEFRVVRSGRGRETGLDALWDLSDNSAYQDKIPLSTRIERIVADRLAEKGGEGCSRFDLNQSIYYHLREALTPTEAEIKDAVEKVAAPREGDGNYFLGKDATSKRHLHTRVLLAVAKWGLQEELDVSVSQRALERMEADEFKAEWPILWERYGPQLERGSAFARSLGQPGTEANVLWVRDDSVICQFEVEESADEINRTIGRLRAIAEAFPASERAIVCPQDELEKDTISRKLSEKGVHAHLIPNHAALAQVEDRVHTPATAKDEGMPGGAKPFWMEVESVDRKGDSCRMRLKCSNPDILARIEPGHFLMVRVRGAEQRQLAEGRVVDSYQRLVFSRNQDRANLDMLRIPLSVHRVYYKGFEPTMLQERSIGFLPPSFWKSVTRGKRTGLGLLFRVVGRGTQALAQLKPGSSIDALGPLGSTIDLSLPADGAWDSAILVAGGVGIASLYPIAHRLREFGVPVILFAGAKDRSTLLTSDFEGMGVTAVAVGEEQQEGLVTEALELALEKGEYSILRQRPRVFACGPWGMLRRVHEIAAPRGFPCTVLVDKLMACGVGACMSCIVRTSERPGDPSSPIVIKRACTEGPAFDSREVVWEQWVQEQ